MTLEQVLKVIVTYIGHFGAEEVTLYMTAEQLAEVKTIETLIDGDTALIEVDYYTKEALRKRAIKEEGNRANRAYLRTLHHNLNR